MAGDTESPILVSGTENYRLATWRGHVLVTYKGNPQISTAQLVAREVTRAVKVNPGRAAYFGVLGSELEMPSADVRSIYVKLLRTVGVDLNSAALVIEGTGFGVSARRGMLTGLGIAAGVKLPLKGFSTVLEAGAWAGPRIRDAGGSFGTSAELVDAFASIAQG